MEKISKKLLTAASVLFMSSILDFSASAMHREKYNLEDQSLRTLDGSNLCEDRKRLCTNRLKRIISNTNSRVVNLNVSIGDTNLSLSHPFPKSIIWFVGSSTRLGQDHLIKQELGETIKKQIEKWTDIKFTQYDFENAGWDYVDQDGNVVHYDDIVRAIGNIEMAQPKILYFKKDRYDYTAIKSVAVFVQNNTNFSNSHIVIFPNRNVIEPEDKAIICGSHIMSPPPAKRICLENLTSESRDLCIENVQLVRTSVGDQRLMLCLDNSGDFCDVLPILSSLDLFKNYVKSGR